MAAVSCQQYGWVWRQAVGAGFFPRAVSRALEAANALAFWRKKGEALSQMHQHLGLAVRWRLGLAAEQSSARLGLLAAVEH